MAAAKTKSNSWLSVLILGGGVATGSFLLMFLLAFFGGPTFAPFLSVFGIAMVGDGGVFIDCSKYENRNNEFCYAYRERLRGKTSTLKSFDTQAPAFSLTAKKKRYN